MFIRKCFFFDAGEGGGGGASDGQEPNEGDAKKKEKEAAAKATEQDLEDDGDGGLQDVKALQAELKRVRNEAAKYRTDRKSDKAAMDKLRVQIAQALGIEAEDATPDKLAKELSDARGQLRKERIENQFTRLASTLDADPELTLAYMEHKGMLKDLDPSDEDFADELASRIKQALKANQKLKATPAGNRSGSEFGKDGGTKKGAPSMNDVLRKAAGII